MKVETIITEGNATTINSTSRQDAQPLFQIIYILIPQHINSDYNFLSHSIYLGCAPRPDLLLICSINGRDLRQRQSVRSVTQAELTVDRKSEIPSSLPLDDNMRERTRALPTHPAAPAKFKHLIC